MNKFLITIIVIVAIIAVIKIEAPKCIERIMVEKVIDYSYFQSYHEWDSQVRLYVKKWKIIEGPTKKEIELKCIKYNK